MGKITNKNPIHQTFPRFFSSSPINNQSSLINRPPADQFPLIHGSFTTIYVHQQSAINHHSSIIINQCPFPIIIRLHSRRQYNGRGLHFAFQAIRSLSCSVSLPSEAITIRRASRNASRRSRIKLFLLRIVPMYIIQFTKEWNRSIAAIQITFLYILSWLVLT